MSGLGAMMAGGNPAEGRQEDDFYPTPPDVTHALLNHLCLGPGTKVWEPMCGNGAMSRVLLDRGFDVWSGDAVNRGFGVQEDFFEAPKRGDWLITNPPFSLAVPTIQHARTLDLKGMALVLKTSFWSAKSRRELFLHWRPTFVLPLTWRPDFLGKKRPTMDVMWCVWGGYSAVYTNYLPLPRPTSVP